MHDALNQMVQGFMQFWSPFVQSQVVPDLSDGLEMTANCRWRHEDSRRNPQVEVTEVFDSSHILRQYSVIMSGTKVTLRPLILPAITAC